VIFIGYAQTLGMKLAERVNEAAQLCRRFLGPELERLNGATNDLAG
jgi:hypothetical protein